MEEARERIRRPGIIIREGIITGIIGATAVAVWFLIVDTIAGRPLYTPHVLGAGVFGILGPPAGESMLTYVAAYTVFHYAVFMVIGIVLAVIVSAGDNEPAVLAGLAVFAVVFEVGSFGAVALLSQWTALGNIAWYQIGAANLVSLALMATYLFRRHPGLVSGMANALGGRA